VTPANAFITLGRDKLEAYHKYWDGLTVTNNDDYFRRWLFAFCSVHTGWEANVRGYEAIKDFVPWLHDKEALRTKLCWARCGMHNNRARFIHEFAQKFWRDPAAYWPVPGEPMHFLRNRIAAATNGLGLAKTSFALELAFPTWADVVCLDVHMLRLYNVKQTKVTSSTYVKCEDDWLGRSAGIGQAPYIARMAWWDAQQGKEDSRYWSHCLEGA
jgi:hypothetical protein